MMDYSSTISVVEYSNLNTSIWRSESTVDEGVSYAALFNIADNRTQVLSVDVTAISRHGDVCSVQEVWNGTVTHLVTTITIALPPHGSALYRFFNCSTTWRELVRRE